MEKKEIKIGLTPAPYSRSRRKGAKKTFKDLFLPFFAPLRLK